MQSDDEDSADNWNKLKSINAFDRHGNTHSLNGSTQIVGGSLIANVASKATTPVSLLVESLVQQLCTMFDPDPIRSKRLYTIICKQLHQMNLIDNTYEMGEFELMRSQYQRALYQLVTIAKQEELPQSLQSVWPLSQSVGMDWSRYYREFDEMEFIAGGGFGKVYRAKHKLDDTVYAIKKITIRVTDINRVMSHFVEVKTLAALHHINIVPYKAAWLEPLLAEPNDGRSIENTAGDETETTDGSDIPTVDENPRLVQADDTSESIVFEQPDEQQEEAPPHPDAVLKYTSRKSLKFSKDTPRLHLKWATLYIQMALCQLTLREWLDSRNESPNFDEFYRSFAISQSTASLNRQTSQERKTFTRRSSADSNSQDDIDKLSHLTITTNIMRQLFNGLEYIHAKGIIHHDIKPSNIFIGIESGQRILVQLGDFGLACPLQDEHKQVIAGTPIYAAPEQLNGICNPKSDIYSLGIVLIELLIGFKTRMERNKTLEDARSGKFTAEMPSNIVPLVKSMLCYHHKRRPDIIEAIERMNKITSSPTKADDFNDELQSSPLNIQNSSVGTSYYSYNDIDLRETEIQTKNEEIRIKDQQIEILQTQIETQSSEIVLKDEEINRLRSLLNLTTKK